MKAINTKMKTVSFLFLLFTVGSIGLNLSISLFSGMRTVLWPLMFGNTAVMPIIVSYYMGNPLLQMLAMINLLFFVTCVMLFPFVKGSVIPSILLIYFGSDLALFWGEPLSEILIQILPILHSLVTVLLLFGCLLENRKEKARRDSSSEKVDPQLPHPIVQCACGFLPGFSSLVCPLTTAIHFVKRKVGLGKWVTFITVLLFFLIILPTVECDPQNFTYPFFQRIFTLWKRSFILGFGNLLLVILQERKPPKAMREV